MSTSNTSYQYSTDWFSHNIQNLAKIFQDLKPIRILEVGSFEGRSTSFFIEEALKYQPSVEIYCLDTTGTRRVKYDECRRTIQS